MSNLDKAAQMIRDLSEVDGETLGYAHVHNIAQDLADAGLLAPELPEPSRGMFPHGAAWYLAGSIGDIRRMGGRIVAFGNDYRRRPFRLVLTEAEAETIAHALLAAANSAEAQP